MKNEILRFKHYDERKTPRVKISFVLEIEPILMTSLTSNVSDSLYRAYIDDITYEQRIRVPI